jgi:radical SAM superfamily enzyme YgiQ (UPF0313 family)
LMKVTFLMPPALNGKAPERIFGCNYGLFYQPNIFILYLASVLENDRHPVKVADCPIMKMNWDGLKRMLQTDDSDLYVFYTVFLSEEIDKAALRLIRETRGNIPVVFMGPEPTSNPEGFMMDDKCFIIRGEAKGLCRNSSRPSGKMEFSQVLGLTFMDGDKITSNSNRPLIDDLDSVPFPDRSLVDKKMYYNPKLRGRPSTVMLTSRGCWGRCIYCIPCSYMFAREIDYRRFCSAKPPSSSGPRKTSMRSSSS